MSQIFGGSQASKAPNYTGLNIQTSAAGVCISVLWGTQKIAPNLLWYGDFQRHKHSIGKGGCFAKGTMVETPWGPRPLGKPKNWVPRWLRRLLAQHLPIAEGDPVYCRSLMSGRVVVGEVKKTFVHLTSETKDKMVYVKTTKGEVYSTERHWVFTNSWRYVEAQKLAEGDSVVAFQGTPAEVLSVTKAPDCREVFNLSVEPFHNFFANGLMVHNGGGGKEYTYSAAFVWGLCEGIVDSIGLVWNNQAVGHLGDINASLLGGPPGQSPWSYLVANHPSQADGYSCTALVVSPSFDMGGSPSLPNFNFEAQRRLDNPYISGIRGTDFPFYSPDIWTEGGTPPAGYVAQLNVFDVPPDYVVFDAVTNRNYGAAFVGNLPSPYGGDLQSATFWVGNIEAGYLQIPSTHSEVVDSSSTHIVIPTAVNIQNLATLLGIGSYGAWPLKNFSVVDTLGNLWTEVPYQYGIAPPRGSYMFVAAGASSYYVFNILDASTTLTLNFYVVAGFLDYFYFTYFNKLWISPYWNQQKKLSDTIQEIADLTYSDFVWSSGYLQLRPKVKYSSGGGVLPPSPVFDLTDDHFLPNQSAIGDGSADDPVQFTLTRLSDQINYIQLEYLDRYNAYSTAIAPAQDQALIDLFQQTNDQGVQQAHIFADATAANNAAQLMLQKQYIRRKYYFTLPAHFCVLDPDDIVTLTHGILNKKPVLLREITENDDGTLNFEAEEYLYGVGQTAQYTLNQNNGYVPNTNSDPGNVNTPIFFPYPTAITGGALKAGIAISGASTNWGGADVYASWDNSTYVYIGTQTDPARMGVLTADFPISVDPDTSVSFSVDVSESSAVLASGTTTDADNANTLCYITGEFLSYSMLTLTSASHYTASAYIRRGQFASGIHDHPSGSAFCRVDSQIFLYPYTAADVGKTIYLKFCSFNLWGGGLQTQAEATAYSWVIGSPFDTTTVSVTKNYGPDWLGTLSGFVRHYTGVIYPDSTVLASAMTDTELWDTFVYSPVASPTFTGATIDIGLTTSVTVSETDSAFAGPGVAGSPLVTTKLDQWASGGTDPGTYNPWTSALTSGEYFIGRVTQDTSVPSAINQFTVKIFT